MAMETKTCWACKQTKPLTDFYVSRANRDGRKSDCSDCSRAANAVWYKTPGGRQYNRDRQLLEAHGLTPEQRASKIATQDGKCACCGDLLATDRTPHVDHDHACCPEKKSCSKCQRGMLCQPCNTMLGDAKDDPARLRAGIAYLEKWERAKTPLVVQHWKAPTITAEMLN
jgi:hypothetical protein